MWFMFTDSLGRVGAFQGDEIRQMLMKRILWFQQTIWMGMSVLHVVLAHILLVQFSLSRSLD